MPNLLNLDAEIGANLIANDAQPAAQFQNTGTGPGLQVYGLVVVSTASVDTMNFKTINGDPTIVAGAAGQVPLTLQRNAAGQSTVALLALNLGSTASAPVFQLGQQGFVSCTTILFTTGATAGTGAVRVKIADNYGWIPILVDGSVTAAAR